MAYDFSETLRLHGLALGPLSIATLQLNITRLCNQACVHCHVDASPRRREMMSDRILSACLKVLREHGEIATLDVTGGAPELHPGFRDLVVNARALQRRVIVRHNLTVTLDRHPLSHESLQDLPDFFAAQQVEVVSSLPYHHAYFTDKQRGDGVFDKSIQSLRLLNEVGYGRRDGLILNLVYNPVGPFLPPEQRALENDYKRELKQRFGIEFSRLLTITNMPINRFKAQLKVRGTYEEYMERLVAAFNTDAALGVMCRSLLSVSHDGTLYDCDFNQMLGLPIGGREPVNILDFDRARLNTRDIVVGPHCFGCTAGKGSSCGGATAVASNSVSN